MLLFDIYHVKYLMTKRKEYTPMPKGVACTRVLLQAYVHDEIFDATKSRSWIQININLFRTLTVP